MANTRLYKVRNLSIGTVDIGGLATITLSPGFTSVIQSAPDGALGPQMIDLSEATSPIQVTFSDVTKGWAAFQVSTGLMSFSQVQSGVTTGHTNRMTGIVWTGIDFSFQRDADATCTLTGLQKDAGTGDATVDTWAELLEEWQVRADTVTMSGAPDVTDFVETYPTRLYKPNTALFNVSTAAWGTGDIPIAHLKSVSFSLAGNVISDSADGDLGVTAVDIAWWQAPAITVTFAGADLHDVDSGAAGAAGNVLAAYLVSLAEGRLAFDCADRAGGAIDAHTVTLNGVKFTGYREPLGPGYNVYTLNGLGQWRTASNHAGGAVTPVDLTLSTILAFS